MNVSAEIYILKSDKYIAVFQNDLDGEQCICLVAVVKLFWKWCPVFLHFGVYMHSEVCHVLTPIGLVSNRPIHSVVPIEALLVHRSRLTGCRLLLPSRISNER